MIRLEIPPFETYLENIGEFISINVPTVIHMEHSLFTISKWEEKWHIPYLVTNDSQAERTPEQTLDYLRCMIVEEDVDQNVIYGLRDEHMQLIKAYVDNPATATVITKNGNDQIKKNPKAPKRGKIITTEQIYYWMSAAQIPYEPCEHWHINRLLMLLEVANEESNPDKNKMSKNDVLKSNKALNDARRAKLKTKG